MPADRSDFSLSLNGRVERVTGVGPDTTLLDWIRSMGMTGTKEGCAEGDCGACTIIVSERSASGRMVFRSINSCIALLPTLAGKEIWTVEGLAQSGPHAVQTALSEHFGSQCGFCTPGFVASLFEGCHRDDIQTLDDLNDQLCGNLCRCTGYRPIRDAAIECWTKKGGCNQNALSPSPLSNQVPSLLIDASGDLFCQPGSLEELWEARSAWPDATFVAGGTEVGVAVAKSFVPHRRLISLQRIRELLELRWDGPRLWIGGGVVLSDVMPQVKAPFPSLYEMLRWFASRPIRNRATLGGNLATASPIGDAAPVLMALDAQIVLAGPEGRREMPLTEFFTGYRKTRLSPNEVILAVVIPRPGTGRRLEKSFKISKRREMDISIVSAAFCVDLDERGMVTSARFGFGGVAPTPVCATAISERLIGKPWPDKHVVREVTDALEKAFHPITDGRGTMEYRAVLPARLWESFVDDPRPASRSLPLDGILPAPKIDAPPHESGLRHACGSARYVDDDAQAAGALHVWPVVSPHAHAKILRRDASKAAAIPGVRGILMAEDVPGLNDIGASRHDEPLLAFDEVSSVGQIVAAVIAETPAICREAAGLVEIEYEPLPAVVSLPRALQEESFHTEFHTIARGNADDALMGSDLCFDGEFSFGGQEHFYLECQAAWAETTEDDLLMVHSSTQHPSEIQAMVSHVTTLDRNRVVVHSPRMGGGFGGKETQGAAPAALAALAALRTGHPCRVRYNRDQDFMMTGKRHPFLARFEVGADRDGKLLALKVELFSNGGWSLDLSQPICDRALFHLDNAYYLPNVLFRGRVCKTNLPSNTAFRGFGGPQGMLVIEEILDRVARRLGLDPHVVRERNLYHGSGETNTTHYGQEIGDNRIQTLWHTLKQEAAWDARRKEIEGFNASSPFLRRGLAQTPVKFGISFTFAPYNQAGALVLVYTDGSVQVNHGGTEMGQGLHTKIQGVVCRELGLSPENIRVTQTRTDKIPNTSATAASSGSDLNGAAVRDACQQIRTRLVPIAERLLNRTGEVCFAKGRAFIAEVADDGIPFAELVAAAYLERIPLAAFGSYRTPGIHYDRATGKGTPFYYFACGSAISEVEVDTRTGRSRLRRVDILHDVGSSLNEGIDRGQVEGGFVQGMGWLTSEELLWNEHGHLLSHGASTYQIPTLGDVPPDFRVRFLGNASQPGTIHGSKAVGEPPFMLAISVREAIRDAIAADGRTGEIPLASPATCEAVFRAAQGLLPSRLEEGAPVANVTRLSL